MPTTQHPVKPAAGATADKLDVAEVTDEADTAPRTDPPDTSGKRVRAIPYQNASTVILRTVDINTASQGKFPDHPQVVWDFRVNNFTLPVGKEDGQVDPDVADWLTKTYPTDFEYMNED